MIKKPRYHNLKNAVSDTDFKGKDLALKMGMSPTYFSGVINGSRKPNLDFIYRLAIILKRNPQELILNNEDLDLWLENNVKPSEKLES